MDGTRTGLGLGPGPDPGRSGHGRSTRRGRRGERRSRSAVRGGAPREGRRVGGRWVTSGHRVRRTGWTAPRQGRGELRGGDDGTADLGVLSPVPDNGGNRTPVCRNARSAGWSGDPRRPWMLIGDDLGGRGADIGDHGFYGVCQGVGKGFPGDLPQSLRRSGRGAGLTGLVLHKPAMARLHCWLSMGALPALRLGPMNPPGRTAHPPARPNAPPPAPASCTAQRKGRMRPHPPLVSSATRRRARLHGQERF